MVSPFVASASRSLDEPGDSWLADRQGLPPGRWPRVEDWAAHPRTAIPVHRAFNSTRNTFR